MIKWMGIWNFDIELRFISLGEQKLNDLNLVNLNYFWFETVTSSQVNWETKLKIKQKIFLEFDVRM